VNIRGFFYHALEIKAKVKRMTSKASLPPFISELIALTSFQPEFPAKSDGKESPPHPPF
jgi:hypothetical protein